MNSSVVEVSAELCPDMPTLIAYQSGRLSEPDAELLAVHIETCGVCSTTLKGLGVGPMDPFEAQLLRFCGGQDTFNKKPEPPYHQLELRALALNVGDTLPPNSEAGDTTDFSVGFTGAIGPYTLQDILGRGGMGVVYRAVHQTLRRPVALKTLYAGAETRPTVQARFQVEGEAIARLDHPNIVKVYDFGESDEQQYLAMELVAGETLSKKMLAGPLDCDRVVRLVHALAGAVEYAHSQGVIHRDLKPSNVLITREDVPKIVDFGLARLLGDSPRLTASDAVMGTPNYMAPEQAEGHANDINEQTDVYALGVILYEALTGGPLFAGENKLDILRLVRAGNFVSPRQLCSNISLDLETICLKCLERSQRDRYRSATELKADLERLIQGDPVVAKRPTRWQLLRRSVRRRAPVLVAVLVVVGLVGAVAAWMPKLVVSTIPNGESPGQRELALQEVNQQLDANRPATLVGAGGWPKWFRWSSGESSQRMKLDPDGVLTVEVLAGNELGLLELLPDPRHKHYQLFAELRHDDGGQGSSVGLYVGRQSLVMKDSNVNFMVPLTWNVVAPVPYVVETGAKRSIIEGQTAPATLAAVLRTESGSLLLDTPLFEEFGPRSQALGSTNGVWHKLSVTVGPESVSGLTGSPLKLSMKPLSLTPENLKSRTAALAAMSAAPSLASTFKNMELKFEPRGGLGIVVSPGATVGIRRVSVAPLAASP